MNFLKDGLGKAKSGLGLDKDKKQLEAEQANHEETKTALQNSQHELQVTKEALLRAQHELGRERARRQELETKLQEIEDEKNAEKSAQDAAREEEARKAFEAMAIAESAKKIALQQANDIHAALHGSLLVDDKKIAQILSASTTEQLQVLKGTYLQQYGKDLHKVLSKALGGTLRQFVLALMTPLMEYKCQLIKEACSGLTTDEMVLAEIIPCLSNAEIATLKSAYNGLYSKDLLEVVTKSVSGNDMKKLYTILLQGKREDNATVDTAQLSADANTLYQASDAKLMGCETTPFITILANRSPTHLAALNGAYINVNKKGRDLFATLKKYFSGSMEATLSACLVGQTIRPGFFAVNLGETMEGIGCQEEKLARFIRYARDDCLKEFIAYYDQNSSPKLDAKLKDEISGNLRRSVLQVCGFAADW